jgi:hypothetical protein
MARADQDRVAFSVRDQEGPPLQEGAHEEVAQLGIRQQEGEQRFAREGEHLAIVPYARRNHRAAPEDQIHVAGKLARAVDRDRLLASRERLHDLDASREDHVKVHPGGAQLTQHLASPDGSALASTGEAGDLGVAQLGEQAVPIRGLGRGNQSLRVHSGRGGKTGSIMLSST